ncbi:MAG: AAA family ATPase [Candidatus Hydrogenedentota bacterium]
MESQEKIGEFQRNFGILRSEIGKFIVGYDRIVESILTAMLCGGNVLLEGVPGLGKTMLVRALGQALDLSFRRIQFTPDLMPADITGTYILSEENGQRRFVFRQGPLFAHIVLADEVNRATPKTQSALLEAMQEHSVTVGGEHHKLIEPFFVLATQNPIEMEGTYPLPEAQLDRFFFKLKIPFPSEAELNMILDRTTSSSVPELSKVMNRAAFLAAAELVRDVILSDHLRGTISRIILATHPETPHATELARKYVRYGASPRAAQAISLAAKVTALLDGRGHVAAEDILPHLAPALRHRIILNFEGEADGVDTDAIALEIANGAFVKP